MTSEDQATSFFVDLGGSRRHVLHWRRDGAPTLVLLHGMRDHAHSWDWVARRLSSAYNVIAPDLRGHGDSDWSQDGSYSLFNYVSDLAEIIDTLGLNGINLVGHSLGGHIALRFAASFPDRLQSLCTIEGIELPIVREQRESPTSYPVRLRRWIEDERGRRRRQPRYYQSVSEAADRMAEQNPGINRDTVDHLTRTGLVAVAGSGLRWKYDNACRFRAPDDADGTDLDEILGAISCPTLLAYGESSWIPVPPAERLLRLRSHELVTFPGASHWLHHQSREAFQTVLEDFLSRSSS
ncbi:alpha/beta fold hydrolase [Sphingomonas sp. ID0503]|uniref:alpha/beta fold hydrolase n=1 Tax=Sphingomonas sp. ID0503 TaxID=3399691 RepID=UPI003AFA8385